MTERGRAAWPAPACPDLEGTHVSVHKLRMAGVVAALGAVAVLGATTFANGPALTDAGSANTKSAGVTLPDKISPQWRETTVAQGSNALENPSALTNWYGYYNDGPMIPAPGDVQAKGHNVEATKSEPDKNTYLVVDGQHGADPKYDYGTHFLYQGHELGTSAGSYITRINLDADAAHRVTKLAETEADGKTPVPTIDGSTWDPFAQRLLFTTEGGTSGGVVEATLDYPSKVSNLWGVMGQGGFEGIQNDSLGNVYAVEDIGGAAGTSTPTPSSRTASSTGFCPTTRRTWTRAASCRCSRSLRSSTPAPSSSTTARPTTTSSRRIPRTSTPTAIPSRRCGSRSMTPPRTARRPSTPPRRPRRPAGHRSSARRTASSSQDRFKKFFFTETGDTTLTTEAGTSYGGFGGIQELWQDPKSDKGTLRLFYQSDKTHSSFDNVTFFDKSQRDRRAGSGRQPA